MKPRWTDWLAAAALALALSAGAAVSPPDDTPVLARAR
ncbi:hypothetical protein X805_38810 [Sphaerotilus natans subsp. natans DSM 6575]|jgi:hypothetical protein|uniref:Uncharacterized protein n=1 Tax=Sphaerotilus natans subsp. natans DSM 6575 TaxID=1286631 RepID=A0A059KH71_9BURK|nr:hypothetical protein X805_38810 [Sphaerotilus natans subsp. natans DSM 6575]SIQ24825.1 hypothetical protein SAMN05421778_102158 [Sphaerotilus natans]